MATLKTGIAPWLVDEKDFPRDGSRQQQLRFLLHYAVLAPSFYNSQPWRFSIGARGEQIDVYVDKSSWYKTADPEQRELYVSMGCALENLFVAIDYFKLGHQTVYFPDPQNDQWVATIRLVTPRMSQGPRARQLFPAITERRDTQHVYQDKQVAADHLALIRKFLTEIEYTVYLDVSDNRDVKMEIEYLIGETDAAMFSNQAICQELATWLEQVDYGGNQAEHNSGTGQRDMSKIGEQIAKQDKEIIKSAPVIAVLSSRYDNRISQVKAGQTFERICLEATLLGIRIHPLFQLMEVPHLENRLQELFPDMKGRPQLVFSMGYTDQEKKLTPRKPVDEVLR